jgi:hypothetical protein
MSLTYSHPWRGLTLGGELLGGRDVFGDSFTRISGFVRLGGGGRGDAAGADDSEEEDSGESSWARGTELFVDAGVEVNQVKVDPGPPNPMSTSPTGYGPHFGVGARRAVSANNDLGVRLEFDNVDGHALIGARALDWRYRFTDHFALGLFGGVDRYDLVTPAYSLYFGAGAAWRNILPKWDLGFDVRYGQNIARDKVLPTDLSANRPDTFYKIASGVLYIERHF